MNPHEITILSAGDPPPVLDNNRPSLFLLTGPVNSGKTTTLRRWLRAWDGRGWTVGGVVSDAIRYDDRKIGYDIRDVRSGRSWTAIRNAGAMDSVKIGRYHIDTRKLYEAAAAARSTPDCDMFVIDEIGPLELERQIGFRELLDHVLRERCCSVTIVLRRSMLTSFFDHYRSLVHNEGIIS